MELFIPWSTLLLLSVCSAIAALSLLLFYFQLKRVIDPLRRKKGKAIFTKAPTKSYTKKHNRGIMSSSNSSVSIDLDIAEMH
ncbi:hypothetical protein NEFER03_2053 [Nematocida sp. LUAm3]|nr:hypothetical protein NEFER03_2053 [Nematocida sp. LUAm3]KAI5176193.1 hypothetical protein NEFER02_1999 [Nematocida sp. LUAm2]KAI5179181.1 hypothetical protein NEFER01_2038 [Nematocida sp. LUAm1]